MSGCATFLHITDPHVLGRGRPIRPRRPEGSNPGGSEGDPRAGSWLTVPALGRAFGPRSALARWRAFFGGRTKPWRSRRARTRLRPADRTPRHAWPHHRSDRRCAGESRRTSRIAAKLARALRKLRQDLARPRLR